MIIVWIIIRRKWISISFDNINSSKIIFNAFYFSTLYMNYKWGSSLFSITILSYLSSMKCFFDGKSSFLYTYCCAKPNKHKDVSDDLWNMFATEDYKDEKTETISKTHIEYKTQEEPIDTEIEHKEDVFHDNMHFEHRNSFEKKRSYKGKRSSKDDFCQLYKPKSIQQKQYVMYLKNKSMPLVVVYGSAGSGKTLFACMEAIQQLKRGFIQKIVLTRPLIAVEEEEIGFLPGNMNSKMDPWTRPIFDIFREVFEMHEIENMVKHGIIEVAPLAFMRGRTFHRCFVLADEMQNSSPAKMLMLTTRLGKESKLVITGDLQQSDRNNHVDSNTKKTNGLVHFLHMYNLWERTYADVNNMFYRSSSIISQHENSEEDELDRNKMESDAMVMEGMGIGIVEMTYEDVFRSPFVSRILDIYYPRTLTPLEIHFQKAAYEAQQVPDNPMDFQIRRNNTIPPFHEPFDQVKEEKENQENKSKRTHPNYIPLRNMGRPYPE